LLPVEGEPVMRARRGARAARGPAHRLADGPAKLAQALGVDRALNGHDLCARGALLFIERAAAVPAGRVTVGPRVGLNNTPEPWKSRAWNFKTHLVEGA
jgi:DNA-3-methyladenine glycosylase